MGSKGRGNFLRFQLDAADEASTRESTSNKDSGLGTRSNEVNTYRRVGRGKLIEELISSFSSASVSTSESVSTSASCSGRGRTQLIKSISSLEISADEKSEQSRPISVRESEREVDPSTSDIKRENKETSLYMPVSTRGKDGMNVNLCCNYIRLSSDPTMGIYIYEVRFNPTVDSISLRNKYLNEHRDKFGKTKTFDGNLLYLPILLKDEQTTFFSKSVADGSNIEILIFFKKKESFKTSIHFYNILFDRVMKTLNYVRFDRKQYDPTSPKIIPQYKLEVWPGYVTAVDEYDGGLMLCCDVSHRLLSQKSVLEQLVEIYKCGRGDQFEECAKKSLLGSVVITRYNNRTYRIDDICFSKSPLSQFETRNGPISYVDYYRSNYNIEIKDKKQPLLISIKKQKPVNGKEQEDFVFCLIPELAYLTGLKDEMRSDHKLMREIATFTCVSPNQRLLALQKFYDNINNSKEAQEVLSNWGLKIITSNEMMSGRKYKEETINFATMNCSAGPKADFSSSLKYQLLDVIHLRNWLLIHCKSDMKVVHNFIEMMNRNTGVFGIDVANPRIVVLENDRVDTYVHALRQNITSETQIVVCICPTSRDDRYAAIKKVCCAENPIPSQVINSRTISNFAKNRSIVQKIALQMNCKLGGSLWSVNIPFKSKVMICGIDSYHDSSNKGNSVAAFVASLNNISTKWYSKAQIQTKREELVSGLSALFLSSLFAYKKANGTLPDNIIIYRDGVGDGQLQTCVNYEIPQFQNACSEMFPNYKVKITFLVVQKRINTKFFAIRGNDVQNPCPGTIIDYNITRAHMYDFFLVSQSVRQGTVSPTHYIVLRDDACFSPDVIQRLSYKLCFMYYNWPGTIRVPAPCQYAHKMAFLVGQSIRRTTSDELATKLFYL